MVQFTRHATVALPGAGSPTTRTPLIIVTCLFFMWGLLTSLNDVLIPHLKEVYDLSYVQAMLVQSCFFAAFLLVSLPAAALIKRIGYRHGVVSGLAVAALGCALFYPAATLGYGIFLLALFTLASGITILQVAANPYVTALGDPRTAPRRLTLTQAFNSLGTTVAPAIGSMLILGAHVMDPVERAALSAADLATYRAAQAASVQTPYLGLAAVLLLMAVLFAYARLPDIRDAESGTPGAQPVTSLLAHRHLVLGVIGIFLYVGAEVSIGSLLINFIAEPNVSDMTTAQAAYYVSYYWGGAMLGRFVGVLAMRKIAPGIALAFNGIGSIVLILLAMFSSGGLAMWALIAVGLCNSIMFPVIFSMAVSNLGNLTGRGSGLLCMAIFGGAIVPPAQGLLADHIGVQLSFIVPAVCYMYVVYFGLKFSRLYPGTSQPAL
jgi:FHS family L-fucose permease-like MFS transporter